MKGISFEDQVCVMIANQWQCQWMHSVFWSVRLELPLHEFVLMVSAQKYRRATIDIISKTDASLLLHVCIF